MKGTGTMRSVITGGAGFIGSHLAEHLLGLGDEVVVLDDLSTGSADNLAHLSDAPRLEVVEGSVLDRELVAALVRSADRVFHLAAAVGVHRIIERPLEGLRINLHGTENVLEACLDSWVPPLIVSTSEIYGKNTADRLSEDADRILGSPLTARWTYAAAKGLDESFAHAYWREYGLPARIIRPFNTVGPRQTGRYGMVVPTLVGQALRGEPLTVFGDGQQTRCFSYVGDVVPAMVRLSQSPEAIGQAVNLGGAEEISILDLAHRIIAITGSDSPIDLVPYDVAYRDGFEEMRRRVPDNSRARALVGYEPSTGIDEMIRRVGTAIADSGVVRATAGVVRTTAGVR